MKMTILILKTCLFTFYKRLIYNFFLDSIIDNYETFWRGYFIQGNIHPTVVSFFILHLVLNSPTDDRGEKGKNKTKVSNFLYAVFTVGSDLVVGQIPC